MFCDRRIRPQCICPRRNGFVRDNFGNCVEKCAFVHEWMQDLVGVAAVVDFPDREEASQEVQTKEEDPSLEVNQEAFLDKPTRQKIPPTALADLRMEAETKDKGMATSSAVRRADRIKGTPIREPKAVRTRGDKGRDSKEETKCREESTNVRLESTASQIAKFLDKDRIQALLVSVEDKADQETLVPMLLEGRAASGLELPSKEGTVRGKEAWEDVLENKYTLNT